MWVHVPSFLIGSTVSGTGFLIVHQQLSHRSRLSPKWPLREFAESQARNMWAQIRPPQTKSSPALFDGTNPVLEGWNKVLKTMQDALKKKSE